MDHNTMGAIALFTIVVLMMAPSTIQKIRKNKIRRNKR